ncbi:hypothetical protein BDV32DRAFT_151340 [Aspergillus pseudonomiae]|uniref:Uncharacterized protein n=1 Tax=Aspergillus pseudonomiae TaxID=1506151 RepID=A0A5N7D9L5_9EURO|nr:uncharacterized protein BDV37DRAFT_283969 [Aspergillus pseudonomiae]KAB8258522.1 hypothetical protein BDV32DRAFT_151340 [Aspergillus pseudonomiae]KAE8403172.1 hypothetical protein BDV37DRAFT_283969 [Aspergillus pseudonomiae]
MLKLLLASFLVAQHSVQAEPGIFYNPPAKGVIHVYKDNPVYELEQVVQLRWATTLESISILLRQGDNSYFERLQTNLSDVTTFNSIVSTQRSLEGGNVFFFQIQDADEPENPGFFASHYFNITKRAKDLTTTTTTLSSSLSSSSTTTSGSSTPRPSSEALTATSMTLTPANAAPTTPTSIITSSDALTTSLISTTSLITSFHSNNNGAISPQAKAGLGVGVGLGCTFLLTLASVILYFNLRTRLPQADRAQNYLSGSTVVTDKSYICKPRSARLVEVPGRQLEHHELAS